MALTITGVPIVATCIGFVLSLFISFCSSAFLAEFAGHHMEGSTALSARAVVTLDNQHISWPQPDGILFRLDTRYSQQDQVTILDALNEVQRNMLQCIRFMPYNPTADALKPHLYIGPMTTPAVNPDAGFLFQNCFAFPGVVLGRQIPTAQKLGLVNGTNGCLHNKREIMKYIVNSLGLRDEWRRPDRDAYIKVNLANIRTPITVSPTELIRKYDQPMTPVDTRPAAQITVNLTAFDFNSITMPAVTKYTGDVTRPLYTIIPGRVQTLNGVANVSVTNARRLAQLSRDDCEGLKIIYASTCSNIACPDPYGAGATQPNVRVFSIKYGNAGRFQDATVNANWLADSAKNTKGPMCMQNPNQPPFTSTGITEFAEDCLYLDIYVPPGFLTAYYCNLATLTGVAGSAGCQSSTKLPVFLWAWGGQLTSNGRGIPGAGIDLARTLNIIVVIPQFRVGVFGFLSTGDSVLPGNYALSDMKAAFNWVHQNIHLWSGDNAKITISGQSDGAAIVSAMLIDRNIASRVFGTITMSGSILSPWAILDTPAVNAVRLGTAANCAATTPSSALATCLKALPALNLRLIADTITTIPPAPGAPTWSMVIDNNHIPGDPATLLRDKTRRGITGGFVHQYSKQDAAVVALLAFNASNIVGAGLPKLAFLIGGAIPALMQEEVLCAAANIPRATVNLVATAYGMTATATDLERRTGLYQLATDLNHGLVASIKEAQLYAESGASRTGNSISVLAYDGNVSFFSPLTGGTPGVGGGVSGLGAYHTVDVGYLFAGSMNPIVAGQNDTEVTRVFRQQFNSVIKTGRGLGAPFDPTQQNFIELGEDKTWQPRTYQRAIQLIAFWDKLKELGCIPFVAGTAELNVAFAPYP